MDFNSICYQYQQGGVLKLMKNDDFLVFLAAWAFSPMYLGRLKNDWS